MPRRPMLPWLLLLCLLPWALGTTAWAWDVRTAAQDSQPKYIREDGGFSGMCPDLWHAIERVDPQLRFIPPEGFTPLARIELQLEHGEIDAFCSLAKTPQRLDKLDFVHPPVYVTNSILAARMDETATPQNFQDLRKLGATVLVVAGTIHAQVLADWQDIPMDAGARDTSQNLQKLLAGRGRFVLHNDFALADEIQRDQLGDKIKLLPTPMFTDGRYFVVSRKAAPALKVRLATALLTLQRNGELARIFALYKPR